MLGTLDSPLWTLEILLFWEALKTNLETIFKTPLETFETPLETHRTPLQALRTPLEALELALETHRTPLKTLRILGTYKTPPQTPKMLYNPPQLLTPLSHPPSLLQKQNT